MNRIEKNIPFENLENLFSKIDRFNSKAIKMNKDVIKYEIIYPVYYEKKKVSDLDGSLIDINVPMVKVILDGVIPVISGYSFVAKIEHRFDESGSFVGNVVKTREEQINSDLFQKQSVCNHCNTKRFRKETYILKDNTNKEIQVGSECLKDFINKADLEYLVKLASFLKEAQDEENISFGRVPNTVDFINYVAVCLESINQEGWHSKKSETPTYLNSWEFFHPSVVDRTTLKMSSENLDLVKKYIQEDLPNLTDKFSLNLQILAKQNLISLKDCALASTMANNISRKEAVKKHYQKIENEFCGQIGDEISANVEIKRLKQFDTRYGVSYLIEMINLENNRMLKTFTTSKNLVQLSAGDRISIQGRVKEHETYNNLNSTVLRLVKIKDSLKNNA
jgi:hypothetical protein